MPDTNPRSLDETASRCLGLFFILNVAGEPLPTSRIIDDPDLGYGTGNPASDKKRFQRDRARLERYGIHIRQVERFGAGATEEALWEIDRERTHARFDALPTSALERLLRQTYAAEATPLWAGNQAVPTLRAKLQRELAGRADGELPIEGVAVDAEKTTDPVVGRLWELFQSRRPAIVTYRNANGDVNDRRVDIYGFFTERGNVYFLGLDHSHHELRTFRADRVESLRRGTGTYEIPADFELERHLFLPFDFSAANPVIALFSFSVAIDERELESLTHRRGSLERCEEGRWLWSVEVRDLEAAARFALAHTTLGMRPLEPAALVDLWRDFIRKAVEANGRAA